jgi:hypothetical protein
MRALRSATTTTLRLRPDNPKFALITERPHDAGPSRSRRLDVQLYVEESCSVCPLRRGALEAGARGDAPVPAHAAATYQIPSNAAPSGKIDVVSPAVAALPVDQHLGNLEGKELRFGTSAGAIAPSVMIRPALEVADILREHGPAWRETSIYR